MLKKHKTRIQAHSFFTVVDDYSYFFCTFVLIFRILCKIKSSLQVVFEGIIARAEPRKMAHAIRKAGFGWEAGKDIERRLHDAWFETLCNLANHNCCLELNNGRCPRDVFIRIPFTRKGT